MFPSRPVEFASLHVTENDGLCECMGFRAQSLSSRDDSRAESVDVHPFQLFEPKSGERGRLRRLEAANLFLSS